MARVRCLTLARNEITFQLADTPESTLFTLFRDDTLVVDTVVVPTYEEIASNGRERGPICLVASEKVTIPGRE